MTTKRLNTFQQDQSSRKHTQPHLQDSLKPTKTHSPTFEAGTNSSKQSLAKILISSNTNKGGGHSNTGGFDQTPLKNKTKGLITVVSNTETHPYYHPNHLDSPV